MGKAGCCPACGNILPLSRVVCPCGATLVDTGLDQRDIVYSKNPEQIKQDIRSNITLKSSLFNEQLWNQRYKEEIKQSIKQKASTSELPTNKIEALPTSIPPQPPNTPRCPTCNSTDIKKIGGVDRAFSVAFWGLASSKIGKTFKCNHCGYTW